MLIRILAVLLILAAPVFGQDAPKPPEKPDAQEEPEEQAEEEEKKKEAPPLKLTDEELSEQIELLESRFLGVRTRAKSVIARVGEPAVPFLKELLETGDPLKHITAIELLSRMKREEAVPAIVFGLKDQNSAIRWSAKKALGQYGPDILAIIEKLTASGILNEGSVSDHIFAEAYREKLLKLLTERAGTTPERWKKYDKISKLGKIAIPGLLALLDEGLKSTPPSNLVSEIITTLGFFKDKRINKRLISLIGNPVASSFKQNMAVTLAKLGDDKYLEEWLSEYENNSNQRDSAYSSIGHLFHTQKDYANAEKYWRKAAECSAASGRSDNVHLYNTACAQSLGGKHDEAVKTLKSAVEKGYRDFDWMSRDTDFDPIRQHPKYLELVKQYSPKHLPAKEEEKPQEGKEEKPKEEKKENKEK